MTEKVIVSFSAEMLVNLGKLHSNVELGILLKLREAGIPVNREHFDQNGLLVASYGKPLRWHSLPDGVLQFEWER